MQCQDRNDPVDLKRLFVKTKGGTMVSLDNLVTFSESASPASIFGILPIALSLGASGGSRQSLGIAVVGGLLFSGLLTLCVVTAVYAILSRCTVKHL